MADKMLLFRASRPDDMPHKDEDMKTLYVPAIKSAIPAFVYYLPAIGIAQNANRSPGLNGSRIVKPNF